MDVLLDHLVSHTRELATGVFSNVILESADKHDEDLYRIVAINTFVMGVLIRAT